MTNLLLIGISLLAGVTMRQVPSIPDSAHKGINAMIIYLALPAITLLYVPQLDMQWAMIYPFIMPFLVWGVAWGFFEVIGRLFHWPASVRGALSLVAGMGNISFVGFPVVEALYGEEGLKVAIFIGQGGFFVVSVIGVLMASAYSEKSSNLTDIMKGLWTFPPFISFIIGLILLGIGWEWPDMWKGALDILGKTLTPLAMVSVGLQLQLNIKGLPWGQLGAGLIYKLLLSPLLVFALYSLLLNDSPTLLATTVIEAGMPPMVTAAIIASEYELAPKLSSSLVGIGLLLSAVTLSLWSILL